ncbi:hypothetical protein MUK42_04237 [Musa troglodytarum]|uniref:Malectin-like domain-containing protein n=1 Tax=Musa troglodytarum TaxID=320322 RepID=A0A9E7GEA2_9LILI|nr:hypothetical protein MUK42_04237 [Musa troglodytarum]
MFPQQAPTFELQFDGNSWATVVTRMDRAVYFEAVHDVRMGRTSICVAQTIPRQLPFVSSIEVRRLENSMYDGEPTYAFFLLRRWSFGATDMVRYPGDTYDRIWVPAADSAGVTLLSSDTTIMDTSNSTEHPPKAVLLNAFTTTDPSADLSLTFADLVPAATIPVYVNLYFAEMTALSSSDVRSFRIDMDGKTSDPDRSALPKGVGVFVRRSWRHSQQSNGVASYGRRHPSAHHQCHRDLHRQQSQQRNSRIRRYSLRLSATGTAILASRQTPAGIGLDAVLIQFHESLHCNTLFVLMCSLCNLRHHPCRCAMKLPLVTMIRHLAGYGLAGDLPDFSDLNSLQTIDLHNNSITGEIPDFLGRLPNLIQLNLADNKLSGAIPSSLTSNNRIKLVTSGNPDLCSPGQACDTSKGSSSAGAKKRSSKLGLILGVAVLVFFAALVATAVTFFLRSRRRAPPVAAENPGHVNSYGKPGETAEGNGHGMFGAQRGRMVQTPGVQFTGADKPRAAPRNEPVVARFPAGAGEYPERSEEVVEEQPMIVEAAYEEQRWGEEMMDVEIDA